MRTAGAGREAQRLVRLAQGLLRMAGEPERPRQVDRHPRRLAARRLVVARQQRLLEMMPRRPEVALVDAGLAELGVRVGREPGVAAGRRPRQQLLGDLPGLGQVGAQEGDVPQAAEHPLEIARPSIDGAQREGPLIGRLDVARGVALGRHQRRAERQQEVDLAPRRGRPRAAAAGGPAPAAAARCIRSRRSRRARLRLPSAGSGRCARSRALPRSASPARRRPGRTGQRKPAPGAGRCDVANRPAGSAGTRS